MAHELRNLLTELFAEALCGYVDHFGIGVDAVEERSYEFAGEIGDNPSRHFGVDEYYLPVTLESLYVGR